MNAGILVLIDHLKGQITDISFEMLGAGRQIADTVKAPLYAVVVGQDTAALSARLGVADGVIEVNHPSLAMPSQEVVAGILKELRQLKQASLLLIAGTNVSMGIGAQLAVDQGLPFINFCKALRAEGQEFLFTSQLFGGKILADLRLPNLDGIVSIYPGSFAPEAGKTDRAPVVEKVSLTPAASQVTFTRFIEPDSADVDITKQDVLIAVGRGVQAQDNLPMAEELAELLHGAVCASRPVIDQGWLPLTRQVGKSGMNVKPKLYVAAGISGAPEHVEGMKNSDLTIAINTDPNAPIFEVAKYGVCGDMLEILPALVEGLKTRKAS
jgi:electron transfer flavoprotein alpha subunit